MRIGIVVVRLDTERIQQIRNWTIRLVARMAALNLFRVACPEFPAHVQDAYAVMEWERSGWKLFTSRGRQSAREHINRWANNAP